MNKPAPLAPHLYDSLEDPASGARGALLISLLVGVFLLPVAVVEPVVLAVAVLSIGVACGVYLYARLSRGARMRRALALARWLEGLPFPVEGFWEALQEPPQRAQFLFVRAELASSPRPPTTVEVEGAVKRCQGAPPHRLRVQEQRFIPVALVLESARLLTHDEAARPSAPRHYRHGLRWMTGCLREVIVPLHQRYPVSRVWVRHQGC